MAAAALRAVRSYLPDGLLSNADLAEQFPEWSVDRIGAKTGILSRHIAGPDEFASDLAIAAARRLFADLDIDPQSIDYLIVCTQTADHVMPSTSLIAHAALGLGQHCGATDITLGCSGYVYALGLAKGLIASDQASNVLLVTADTYSRLLNPADKSVRTLFGDGATATLITEADGGAIGPFVYGSDGRGGEHLVVAGGGIAPASDYPLADPAARGLEPSGYDLYMNGPEIFNFGLRVVDDAVDRLLDKAGIAKQDVDTWIFHQANAYMLGHLRKKLQIPEERFVVELADVGNTVSSTIPIALERRMAVGEMPPGTISVLLGFGVGLSWAGTVVRW